MAVDPGSANRFETPAVRLAVATALTVLLVVAIRATATGAQDVSLGAGTRCGPPVSATPEVLVISTPFVITATSTPLPGANEGTTAALVSAVTNFVACWNDRDWPAVSALMTPEFASRHFGLPPGLAVTEAMLRLDEAGLFSLLRVDRAQFVRTNGSNLATIEVRWRQGSATYADLWRFTYVNDAWLLQEIESLPPTMTGEAVGISAYVGSAELRLSRAAVTTTETIAIDIHNDSTSARTVSVVSLGTAPDIAALLSGGNNGTIAPAGFASLGAGEKTQLRLELLPPGDYLVIVDLHAAVLSGDPARALTMPLTVEPTEAGQQ